MVSGLVGLIVTKTYLRKMCHLNCLMWWMDVWIICNLGVRLDWYGVFYCTGDIQSQIWSGQLSTATPVQSDVKSYQDSWLTSTYFLRLIKQFQLLLRTECWILDLRRWGRPRHERGSTETWYYQLLTHNIRDTAISRANNHTICWEGSWVHWLRLLTPSPTALKIPHQLSPKSPIWASEMSE